MLATQIVTHVQDALGRLLSQYKDDARMQGLITALVSPVQDLENAGYAIDAARSLFLNPSGKQLDMLGTLIGVPRNRLSDATYLSVLRGVIAENYSNSTPDTILTAAANLFQAAAVFIKDPNSVTPWPNLAAQPPQSSWTIPPGAVMSTLSQTVIGGISQNIHIQAANWASFVSGGYIVLDPGGVTQEAYQFHSVTSPNIITPDASPAEAYSHPIGQAVLYAATSEGVPLPGYAQPGYVYTQNLPQWFMGAVALGIGSPAVSPDDFGVIQKLLIAAIPAGVGLFYLSVFDASGAFAFAGPQSWVQGWGSAANSSTGGPFAGLIYNDDML